MVPLCYYGKKFIEFLNSLLFFMLIYLFLPKICIFSIFKML